MLPDQYTFSIGKHNIIWKIISNDILIEMSLSLPKDDAMELWRVKVKNLASHKRKIVSIRILR